MSKIALCPICNKQTVLSESNLFRPFCSKRCRLIDLGQWINESYSIKEVTSIDNEFTINPEQKH